MANPNVISREADPKVVLAPQPFISGAAVIPPALPAPDIHQMMRDYDAAHEAHSATSRTMDTVATGREPTESEGATHEAAEARFLEAELAFCAYVPRTIEESRAKAAFMAERRKRGHFDLYGDTFDALLGSMGSMALALPEEERRQSEFDDLFDRWLELQFEAERRMSQEELDVCQDECMAIETRMAKLTPSTAREMARKVAVWRGIGLYGADLGESGALMGTERQIAEIAGIPQIVPARVAVPLEAEEGSTRVGAPAEEVVPVSALRSLYLQWVAAGEAYNASPFETGTPEGDQLWNRIAEIEEAAMAIEPGSAEDLAFQILIADEDGYMASGSPLSYQLVTTAYRITSIDPEPPTSKPADTVPAARPSPILGLLREFYDLHHAARLFEASDGPHEDEEYERRFYRRIDVIDQTILANPSVSVTDLAVKALVVHDFGEHSCLSVDDPFWQEVRRLTGCYGVPGKEAWNPAWPAPQAEASASPMSDRTFALIEAHRAAEQACDDASTAADLVVLGRPATAEEMRAAEDALEALDAAAVALCEYAPPTLAGSRAKSARLLGCYLVESQEEIKGPIGALARSIAQMVRADAAPAIALETPTRFHEWWNEWLRLDGACDEMSDEEHESALNVLMAVSDDVLAQPTFTAGGVAAKVIIDTRGGDFGLEPPLLAELYALSGLRRPPSDPDGASSLAPWESKNLQLFREWDGIMARYAAEKDDDKSFDILGEAIAVTDEMQGVPCASGLDFAAKIVANINWVDKLSMYEIFSDALAADARDIMSRLGFSYREH